MSKLFAFIGLSGAGKTSIVRELKINGRPGDVAVAVSHTTRPMRAKETNGVDYWFVTDDKFNAMRRRDEFAEAIVSPQGYQYGFTKHEFRSRIDLGLDVLFVATLSGVEEIEAEFSGVVRIWVDAPEFQRKRNMYARGDDVATIDKRLRSDVGRLKEKLRCDYVIYNDAMLSTVINTATSIIEAERHRRT